MSDQWIFFPCTMAKHQASIFYDHGLSESINSIAPAHLLKVRVAFKHPRPDGMPSKEEFPNLMSFEDALLALVQQNKSVFVGRVTTDGWRHFYIYTPCSEHQDWAVKLGAIGEGHGFVTESNIRLDENHDGYWKELFPTEDDWQVIKDMSVLEALQKGGDDGKTARRIDHWAYFTSIGSAEQFCSWLREEGYCGELPEATSDGKYCVCFRHEGTVQLAEITSHTIALRRKASELGGDYDGWETLMCNNSHGPGGPCDSSS